MTNRGFSLIEVLVAMTILTIGVLGLAASSTAVSRMTSEGDRFGESAALASSRIELLRSSAGVNCAGLSSGTETVGAYTLGWTVSTNTTVSMLRDVSVQVSYNSRGTARTSNYATQISCAPAVQ